MTTGARPRAEASDRPKLIADDLPLRVFTTVGATVVIAWLELPTKYALLGVALAPFVADALKWIAERFRLGKLRLLLVTLLFFLLGKDKAEASPGRRRRRSPAGPRSVLVTAGAASVATVAIFTGPELALGNSLVADRKLTFFSPDRKEPLDVAPPTLIVPADLVVEARGPTSVSYRATARDVEDGAVVPSCRPPSGATFPLGSTIVRCTAADAAANQTSRTFSVTVRQGEVPFVVVVPRERRAEAEAKEGAPVRYRASARDHAGRPVQLRCSPRSGEVFPLGASTVTCVASADGEAVTRKFTVVVRDTRPPRLRLPEEVRVGGAGPGGRRVTYVVSAVDAVDGRVEPRCSPRSGSLFAVGQRRVTCTAVDSRGNEARGGFGVVVLEEEVPADSNPPELKLETELAPVEATSPAGARVGFRVSAEDDRDGEVGVACDPRSASVFRVGTTSVECSALDSAGNRSSRRFTVVVRDTRAPELRMPQDPTAEATSAAGAAVRFTATASDVVDGAVTPTCSRASGSTFPLGRTVVTCSARDARDNESRRSFAVTVTDTTPPNIQLRGDTKREATFRGGAVLRFSITATDSVDGPIQPDCSGLRARNLYPLGPTTIACSAADERGNRRTREFVVEVVDTLGPRMRVPGALEAEAASRGGAAVEFKTSATDVVSGVAAVACNPPSGSLFALGATTVTCSAADARGNRSEASFTVTVSDTTPPAFFNVRDLALKAASPEGTVVRWSRLIARDAVDGRRRVVCDPPSGTLFAPGTTTPVTCSATDRSGNQAATSFKVSIGEWSTVD